MSAELVAFREAALSVPSARRQPQSGTRRPARRALNRAGSSRGDPSVRRIERIHGPSPATAKAQLAELNIRMYLDGQLAKTRAQLERVLDNTAFADPAERQAVLSTIQASGKNVVDRMLFSGRRAGRDRVLPQDAGERSPAVPAAAASTGRGRRTGDWLHRADGDGRWAVIALVYSSGQRRTLRLRQRRVTDPPDLARKNRDLLDAIGGLTELHANAPRSFACAARLIREFVKSLNERQTE